MTIKTKMKKTDQCAHIDKQSFKNEVKKQLKNGKSS